jgi:hypothetical protein
MKTKVKSKKFENVSHTHVDDEEFNEKIKEFIEKKPNTGEISMSLIIELF